MGSECWFEITLLPLLKNIKNKICCLEKVGGILMLQTVSFINKQIVWIGNEERGVANGESHEVS